MAADKHIIRKTVIELSMSRREDAFKAQNEVAAYFKEKIVPMLDKLMSEVSRNGEVLRLEKLELDLNKFLLRHPNDTALWKLEESLRQKLNQQLKNTPLEHDTLLSNGEKKEAGGKNREDLFFYLLRYGTLPWWASMEEHVSLGELAKQILEKPSGHFKSSLLNVLGSKRARQRIVHRLPPSLSQQLLEFAADPALLSIYRELDSYFTKLLPDNVRVRQLLSEFALKSSKAFFTNANYFTNQFLKELNDFTMIRQIYETMEPEMGPAIANAIKKSMASNNHFYLGRVKRLFNAEDIVKYFEEENKAAEKRSDGKKATPEKAADKAASSRKDNEDNFEQEELPKEYDFHITNAGLVILGVYLPAFFRELKLVEENKFISEEAAQRGAYLLQRLCAGKMESYEEHDMVLNKILCGLDPYEPLTLDFRITKQEEEECTQLLVAVAANWKALKGTSGEGMREAFFKRAGVLEQQANGWNLKVEKNTIDILIDKLPWSISIVKMPWTETMIFVNW